MSGVALVINSPSSSRTIRRTPCDAGCDGPTLRMSFSPRMSVVGSVSARVSASGSFTSRTIAGFAVVAVIGKLSGALITAHQARFVEDVIGYCLVEVLRVGRRHANGVEGVQAKVIAMSAGWRTWAAVFGHAEVVLELPGSRRNPVFREFLDAWVQSPHDPVGERAAWCVGVFDDQRE